MEREGPEGLFTNTRQSWAGKCPQRNKSHLLGFNFFIVLFIKIDTTYAEAKVSVVSLALMKTTVGVIVMALDNGIMSYNTDHIPTIPDTFDVLESKLLASGNKVRWYSQRGQTELKEY